VTPSGSALEDEWILLHYQLRNPSDRTLHSYARVRRIRMDEPHRTLELSLDDSHVDPDSVLDTHLQVPPFLPVGAHEKADLELRVPRRISKLARGERGAAPRMQQQDLTGFQTIALKVAYSDTPFYYKPGRESIGQQLRAWAKGRVELSHSAEEIGWRSHQIPSGSAR